MPYCPKCNDEFEDWVQVCPDCRTALVDKLPKQPPSKPRPKAKAGKDPLIHIATAPNEPLAMMWAEILENEGIYSSFKSRDLRAALYTPPLLSQCEIHVLASHAEKAREILVPFLREEPSWGSKAGRRGDKPVPTNPRSKTFVWLSIIIISVIIAIYFIVGGPS